MNIIKDILKAIELLRNDNKILQDKIKTLENTLFNVDKRINNNVTISQDTPKLTKTLDALNTYMGEKGSNTYTKFGKVKLVWNEDTEEWEGGTGLQQEVLPVPNPELIVTLTYDPSDGKYKVYLTPTYAVYKE